MYHYFTIFLFLFCPFLSASVEEAKMHLQNQDHEKAFVVFLQALECNHASKTPTIEEERTYEEALKLYLNAQSSNLMDNCRSIVEIYEPSIKQRPPGQLVGFLVAAAHANLGDLSRYFELFYACFCNYPDHYLAHKSKAVLHLKLFERELPGPNKELHREWFQKELELAAERYAADSSLYKLMISYSEDSKKQQTVIAILNRIINNDILIPRADLDFYLQNAFAYVDLDLTQRFVDKAKQWYEYSRVTATAQQRIDQLRALQGNSPYD